MNLYSGIYLPALVFYDHILMLPRAVKLIWSRKLSCFTLLFYLNRYTIFVWAVIGPTTFINKPSMSVSLH
ncbi:hypothetical protein OBBRIDRAFT_741139 [Obba rivulosa]|uniref:DUF6533 domain-containing protein n=1 Tax=Obba rivulosa TaxID=1052685 RepID=A0A8E2DF95_9APHY|nr:hypothetical protein OBBRIDRAFT_741139 [Obba rivulosa]